MTDRTDFDIDGNPEQKSSRLKQILLYLPFRTRLVLYLLISVLAVFMIVFHLLAERVAYLLIFSLLPIVLSGWVFSYSIVILTTIFFIILNIGLRCLLFPVMDLADFLPSISFHFLYMIIGSIARKIITLYKELYGELMKKQQAEELLERERYWFRITLLSLGDGIITISRDKKIRFMNYEAERMTAWSLEEGAGKDLSEVYNIINEQTRERIYDPVERIIRRGCIIGLANHTILVARNGREIPIGDSGSPIKDRDGKILGFVIIFRNVSQKKRLQGELNRTRASAIQSEKMAGIGQLAAGLAHEVNNPLGYINSNLETLTSYVSHLKRIINIYQGVVEDESIQQQAVDLKIDFILNDIDALLADNREGIQKIAGIIRNLMDFARNTPGAQREQVSLKTVIENVLLIVRSEVNFIADLRLHLPEMAPVSCNAGEINQAVMNLILNAAYAVKCRYGRERAHREGMIEISLSCDDDFIQCRIRDNGCGIAQNNLARIFEPFFTTREPGEGTGLGLFIVYDIIVKKHRGEILVNSREGEGSEFIVKLPLEGAGKEKSAI